MLLGKLAQLVSQQFYRAEKYAHFSQCPEGQRKCSININLHWWWMILLPLVSYSHHYSAEFAETEYDPYFDRNIKITSFLGTYFSGDEGRENAEAAM